MQQGLENFTQLLKLNYTYVNPYANNKKIYKRLVSQKLLFGTMEQLRASNLK